MAQSKSSPAKIAKPKNLSLEKRMSKHGYVFTAPFIFGFLVIFVFVIAKSIQLSFGDLNIVPDPYELKFVGFDNYFYALRVDPDFLKLVVATVAGMIPETAIIIIFSLFIATLLNHDMRGKAFFRAVFFLPVILATGIVARADTSQYILSFVEESGAQFGDGTTGGMGLASLGELGYFFEDLFYSTGLTDIITGAVNNIYNVINHSGVQILLFLAGLQAISPAIYESASIEGCTGWEAFWKITFPMISPIILVNVVYSAIDSFTRADNPIMAKIQGLTGMQGVGSAMAWIYFLMIIVVLGLVFLVFSRLTFYQQKD